MGWEEGKRRLERKKRKVYRAREGMFKHTHSHTLAPYTCVHTHSIVAMSHNFFPPSLPLPIILLIALLPQSPWYWADMRQRRSYHLTSHLGKPGKTKQRADRGKEPIKISTRGMGIKQESHGKEKQPSQELVL